MYESIDYVLGSYFSPVLEFSEDEGMSRLNGRLNQSDALKTELERDLLLALSDPNFSALIMLEDYDIVNFQDEDDARRYLKKILWEPYFGYEFPR